MPLDQTDYISPGNQKLLNLARILREGDFLVPWGYGACHTCAMQVARYMLGDATLSETIYELERTFDLTLDESDRIFMEAGKELGKSMREVTPDDVANIIEDTIFCKIYA